MPRRRVSRRAWLENPRRPGDVSRREKPCECTHGRSRNARVRNVRACVRSDDPRVGTVAGEQAYTRRRARERFASLRDGKQPRNPGPRSRLDRTGVTFFYHRPDEQTRSRPSRRSVGRSRLEPLASGTRLTAGEPVVLGSRSRPRLTHARRDDARQWTRAPRSRAPGAARGRQLERGKPTPRTRRRKSRRTGLRPSAQSALEDAGATRARRERRVGGRWVRCAHREEAGARRRRAPCVRDFGSRRDRQDTFEGTCELAGMRLGRRTNSEWSLIRLPSYFRTKVLSYYRRYDTFESNILVRRTTRKISRKLVGDDKN